MTSKNPITTPIAHVEAIQDSLPSGFEWSEREAAILDLAGRQAADLEALEADIATNGIRSSSGRLNPAVQEARLTAWPSAGSSG